MPPVSAVLFDWDGTLADTFSATRHASLAVFRHFGIAMDDDRYRATYQPDWHDTYRQLGIPETRWEEAGAIWLARYREQSAEAALCPGAREVVEEFADSGVRLGVVTSAERGRVAWELDRSGLARSFETLIAFEDTRCKKPHPEGLLLALERLGTAPANAVYVGDRPEDVAMGRRAGTRTMALVSAFSSEAMLRTAGPDLLLPGIGDLPAALRRLAGERGPAVPA